MNGYPPNSDEAAGTISYLVRAFCRFVLFLLNKFKNHLPIKISVYREYKINQEDNAAGIPGILIGANATPKTDFPTKNQFDRPLSK